MRPPAANTKAAAKSEASVEATGPVAAKAAKAAKTSTAGDLAQNTKGKGKAVLGDSDSSDSDDSDDSEEKDEERHKKGLAQGTIRPDAELPRRRNDLRPITSDAARSSPAIDRVRAMCTKKGRNKPVIEPEAPGDDDDGNDIAAREDMDIDDYYANHAHLHPSLTILNAFDKDARALQVRLPHSHSNAQHLPYHNTIVLFSIHHIHDAH